MVTHSKLNIKWDLTAPIWIGIIFCILKAAKVIEWSWLWVLAPFWIPVVIYTGLMIFMCLSVGVIALLCELYHRKEKWYS